MNASYLLALDQGTSSSRSIVFDAAGAIVAMAQRNCTQIYPQPGWVEHDALEIWDAQLATAREALAKAGITARRRAIGITNQRETAVVWNRKTGRPIHHAIVWQDRRGEPLCAQLREQGRADTDPAAHRLADRLLLFGHQGALAAGQRAGRARAGRARRAGLRHHRQLAAVEPHRRQALHATDVSNASRTMLFDIHRNAWDAELLKAAGGARRADAAGAALQLRLR
jgi:glycerol kinase